MVKNTISANIDLACIKIVRQHGLSLNGFPRVERQIIPEIRIMGAGSVNARSGERKCPAMFAIQRYTVNPTPNPSKGASNFLILKLPETSKNPPLLNIPATSMKSKGERLLLVRNQYMF